MWAQLFWCRKHPWQNPTSSEYRWRNHRIFGAFMTNRRGLRAGRTDREKWWGIGCSGFDSYLNNVRSCRDSVWIRPWTRASCRIRTASWRWPGQWGERLFNALFISRVHSPFRKSEWALRNGECVKCLNTPCMWGVTSILVGYALSSGLLHQWEWIVFPKCSFVRKVKLCSAVQITLQCLSREQWNSLSDC